MTIALHPAPALPRDDTRPDARPDRWLAVLVGALLLGLVAVLLHGVLAAGSRPAALTGLTAADGYLDGRRVSAFDTAQPAIGRLDPRLRTALQEATRAARAAGLSLMVDSGWRSRAYQRELLRRAVATYGSRRAALRWVDTPRTSHHVTGHAVDVGPAAAAAWLDRHGSTYGLCRVYANEPWHVELLTTPGGTCPPLRTTAAGSGQLGAAGSSDSRARRDDGT